MGKIEVFMGPMFSGKTTAMIKKVKELESQGKKVRVFKPARDNRYSENFIYTHDRVSFKAHNIKNLKEAEVKCVDVIAVDEFHFFSSNLIDHCKKWKAEGKHILLAGLDLSYLGTPKKFLDLKKDSEDLKRIANKVHLLKSKCAVCGKDATMTERLVESDEYSLVGGSESYRPVCKEHHPRWKK